MRSAVSSLLAVSIAGCTAPVTTVTAPMAEPPPPVRPYSPPPVASGMPQPPRPMVALSSLIRVPDYPAEAVAARAQGNTSVTLTVHPTGRVTGCMVTESSGSSILDAATCRLLVSRARFHAAQDAAGNPQMGTFATVMTWRL